MDNCQITWATLSFSFCTLWLGIVWLVGFWRLNFSQSQRSLGYYMSIFLHFIDHFIHLVVTLAVQSKSWHIYIYIHMIIIIMANYHMIFGPPYIWFSHDFHHTYEYNKGHHVQFRLPDTTKSQCLMVAPAGLPWSTGRSFHKAWKVGIETQE